jgi:hypothetical protein
MKKPTIKDFIVNVGGLGLIYVITIKITSLLKPGYEHVTVYVVTTAVFLILFLLSLRRKKRHQQPRAGRWKGHKR